MTDVHLEFAMLFNQYLVLVLPRVSHEQGTAVISHTGSSEKICPVQLFTEQSDTPWMALEMNSHWRDGGVWKQSAHNTKWCLIGCSIGDFGTIAAFQFIPYLDALGWTANVDYDACNVQWNHDLNST